MISPVTGKSSSRQIGEVHLIFPHWASRDPASFGAIRHLFPTAYEAPRVRFKLVDGELVSNFPGW